MPAICGASVEVDLSTTAAFAAALRTEIDWAYRRAVFIDCSAITFMDSSAFHALVYAHRYAADRGHRLVLRNLRPNCARLIRLCDSDNELTIGAASDSTAASPVASVSPVSSVSPASKHRPTFRLAQRESAPTPRRTHLAPTPQGA